VIDWPGLPRREPLPPNEHMIPFEEVTHDRIHKGLRAEWHARQLVHPLRYVMPGGTLYMHPADRISLLVSAPISPYSLHLGGVVSRDGGLGLFGVEWDLFTTQDPRVVRRGRPRLSLDDGTEVLL
jgi:hypothetical protein